MSTLAPPPGQPPIAPWPPGPSGPRPAQQPAYGRAAKPPRLPWTWLEAVLLAMLLMPALAFIPGASSLRILNRIGAYALPLAVLCAVLMSSRRRLPMHPACVILTGCAGWLLLSIFHPTTHTLLAGAAQAGLNIAVMAPAFWATQMIRGPRQIQRILVILLLYNAASSAMGVAQFYYPDRFNPPSVGHTGADDWTESMLTYELDDGRKVLRPCGLTDSPGAACMAGLWAAILGVAFAMRPIAWWKRAACLGFALIGAVVIYFTQVRSALLLMFGGMIVFLMILAISGRLKQASVGVVLMGVVAVGSLAWAMRDGGQAVIDRFSTLVNDDIATTYGENRGGFLAETFSQYLPQYPLGAGLGRWGMMRVYFGDPSLNWGHPRGPLWAEISITGWVFDGGAILLFGSLTAIVVAIAISVRIARRSADRDLGYWAAVVAAIQTVVFVQAFGSHAFIVIGGLMFWLLTGALYGADVLARRERARLMHLRRLAMASGTSRLPNPGAHYPSPR